MGYFDDLDAFGNFEVEKPNETETETTVRDVGVKDIDGEVDTLSEDVVDTASDESNETESDTKNEAETEQEDMFSAMGIPSGISAEIKFSYQNKEEMLENANITFDELRKEKQRDFIELEEPDKVTWSVTYLISKDVKNVKQKIAVFKDEIEKDKEFLKKLKATKNRPLSMVIKPRIASKTKG